MAKHLEPSASAKPHAILPPGTGSNDARDVRDERAEDVTARRDGHKRRVIHWLWDEAPAWMSWPIDHGLLAFAVWVSCRLHGHEQFVEMDNRTLACCFCHKRLGELS